MVSIIWAIALIERIVFITTAFSSAVMRSTLFSRILSANATWMYACVRMCLYICVSVQVREREREKGGRRCVCVCVCVCVCLFTCNMCARGIGFNIDIPYMSHGCPMYGCMPG